MSDRYLVGVDVGTSGSKGVLVDLKGRVIARRSLEHSVDTPKPGWYEHDADQVWWGDLVKIVRALISQSGVDARDIASVGISALCPDMLPVDENGRPLRKGILYCDGRPQKQIDDLVDLFTRTRPERITAGLKSTHFAGPKILWFRENEPALFERTAKIHNATGYLVFRLTGEVTVDYGNAGGYAPFLDDKNMRWDEELIREMGLSLDLFPRIGGTTDIAGEVTPEAARETGLAAGTPVIIGTCDASAEQMSVGVVEPGETYLLYGTTMCAGVVVSQAQLEAHPGMPVAPGVIPGTYGMGLGMSASGALTTWFRNNFGQMESEAEAKLGISAYQLLSDGADQIPAGSEGLVVLPYFAGERSPIWDALARGMIIGLTLSHTRRHIYRALLEGVAYSLRHSLGQIIAAGGEIKRIVATGGGIRSRTWTQIVSDVIGMDQEVVLSPHGSPYGDAFMAGYGAGIFNDMTPLRTDWAPPTRKVQFNPEAKKLYDKYFEVYVGLYEKNREAMHRLAELSS